MAVRSRGQFIHKHIGVPLSKGFVVQEDGSIFVRGFFTSDAVDEVGDIITREATENAIPKYRQWGNIRYMHMPKPVAKVLNIGKDDGLKWNEVEIHVIDPEAVFQVKNGLLKALSVGIIISSWADIEIDEETGGWTIVNYDLVEISLVDHPANYDARLFLDEEKSVPMNRELRQMVVEHGFAMVSKALGAVTTPATEEGIDMTKLQKDLQPEEEIVAEETIEEEIEASVDEAEELAEEETEEVLESSVDEEEEALEAVEEDEGVEEVLEDLDVRLTEEDEENDPDSVLFDSQEATEETDLEPEEEVASEVDTIEEESIEEEELGISPATVEEYLPLARALIDALSEAEAEVQGTEQPEAEKVEDVEEADEEESTLVAEVLDLQFQVAELTEMVSNLMEPAKRKGQTAITALPHETAEEIQESSESAGGKKPDMLKSAIRNYLSDQPRVTIRERS